MTTRDTPWPDGTPSWIDLSSPDPGAARRFYQDLFGWTTEQSSAGYVHCYLDGRRICGIAARMRPDPPTGWITYFATSDAAAVLDRVRRAGGRVHVEPVRIGGDCTWAIAGDPSGALFGLWQADGHTGAERVNEPGTLVWNEHLSLDYQAAQQFYGPALDWRFHDISDGDFRYATFLAADGREVGGIGQPPAQLPSLAGRWLVYFAATDTDAALDRAVRLGGEVVLPALDTPHGRLAVLRDEQQAVFALLSAA